MTEAHFRPALFKFVKDLKANNTKPWFEKNKSRFEDDVRTPSLQFIADFADPLEKITKHFKAIPKKVGGSLFRVHRDVRFSSDPSPYKTHVGIHFRHEKHKSAHAPGYYLHLEPGGCFVGVGIWRPESDALKDIRSAIVDDPAAWRRARDAKQFRARFDLEGESLKRPPRGFDAEHECVDDIKRKDFIAVLHLKQSDVTKSDFLAQFTAACKDATPFMRWLCQAMKVDF
ncbi:MAG: DUF2461 domain-containing protein [Planctomycetes bacterium]|nr:DUF2461 domain-containing protein [Planctomycetota bacterium]